jgi:hypothetical protein
MKGRDTVDRGKSAPVIRESKEHGPMRWTCHLSGGLGVVLVIGGTILSAPTPSPEPWGIVKGRVVWGPDKLPLQPGKDLIIDPKTRTVKNAFIWLMPDSKANSDRNKPIPIHPDLRDLKEKQVTVDILNGQFVPHLLALRQGQSLIFKNKTNAIQSVKMETDEEVGNPNVNLVIPAGKEMLVGPFKSERHQIPGVSTINPKMESFLWVFSHPYYYITESNGEFVLKNAPAGTYRLVIWHPSHGWVVGDNDPNKFGIRINIPAGQRLDLGDLNMKPLE